MALMTMHDLNLALRFASKFVFLKDGRVFAAGVTPTVTAEMITAVYDVPVMIQHLDGIPLVAPLDSGPSVLADRPGSACHTDHLSDILTRTGDELCR